MPWLVPTLVVVIAFLLASRGGRRVDAVVLGCAWAASSSSLAVASVLVWDMEPSFGPRAPLYAALLTAAAMVLGIIGLIFALLGRLGGWLAHRGAARWASYGHRAALGIGGIVTLTAALHARGRPAVAPDMDPLVTLRTAWAPLRPASVTAGDLRVTVEVRPPIAPLPTTPTEAGWPEPKGSCYVVVTDEAAGTRFEASNLGQFYRYSGGLQCPDAIVTIDPSRRVVHVDEDGLFWSTTRAWKFPGAQPTAAAIWTCRRGRLLEVPWDWLTAAFVGLALSAMAAVHGALASLSDARKINVARAATPERNLVSPGATYRSAPRGDEGDELPSAKVGELAAAAVRRASFASGLGFLALSVGLTPLVVGLLARLP